MITNKKILHELIESSFADNNDSPLSLTEGQLDIASAILDPDINRVWMSTPTRYGKSLTVAAAVCLLLRNPYRREKILIIAPSKEQAQIIMDYIITFVLQNDSLQVDLLDVKTVKKLKTRFSKDRLTWADGREIRILSADVNTNVGDINKAGRALMGQGGSTVIVDEAALIPDVIMSKILRMLGDVKDSKLVLISNPFNDWYFYRASLSDRFYKIWIDWKQAVREGRFTQSYIDEMQESMKSDMFSILYEVKFILGSADSFIQNEDIVLGEAKLVENQKNEEWMQAMENEPLKVGVDVARGGGDFTEIIIRKGYQIKYRERMNTRNTMDIVNKLVILQKEWGFEWEEVYIDIVNIGAGVVDRLDELGYAINGVSGAESADTIESYFNMRAELWGRLKDTIRAGGLSLSDQQELKGQIVSVKFKYRNRKGFVVILLESKEEMKNAGKKSPDIADALSLTYYERRIFGVESIPIG